MTAIKVCGLTSPADAIVCADAGVDMLGLNFSPQSPRCVTLTAARAIVSALRGRVKFVGVFVNQEREFVQATADELTLDAVQLHGDESSDYMQALRVPQLIKALRVQSSAPQVPASDAILLDTWNERQRGGTGETFDWSIAIALRPQIKHLILAGGLTPENVGAAIEAVRPDAVDVCSGVEDAPGRKSALKVQRFVGATRR